MQQNRFKKDGRVFKCQTFGTLQLDIDAYTMLRYVVAPVSIEAHVGEHSAMGQQLHYLMK
jgi:hypothetical protein